MIMNKKVALPVNRSSLVVALDFCTEVLVAEIKNGVITQKSTVAFNEPWPSLRAYRLKELQVGAVVCGAVSDALSMTLWHYGIEVHPGFAGDADRLVGAYVHGELLRYHTPDFKPGFRKCCGGGNRRRAP